MHLHRCVGFPGGTGVKNLRANGFDPWFEKIPWRKKWQPTPVFLPEEFHGQRSLVGYSPWDHKELDMTDHAHTHINVSLSLCIYNLCAGLVAKLCPTLETP